MAFSETLLKFGAKDRVDGWCRLILADAEADADVIARSRKELLGTNAAHVDI